PEWWNQPFHRVARRMSLADDVALLVYLVPFCGDDFAWHWNVAVRKSDAIKLNLQIAFAHKVARLFVRFQVPAQITSSREYRLPKLAQRGQMATHRIADVRGFRGKIWFIHSAAQQRARRHKNVLRFCARLHTQKQYKNRQV